MRERQGDVVKRKIAEMGRRVLFAPVRAIAPSTRVRHAHLAQLEDEPHKARRITMRGFRRRPAQPPLSAWMVSRCVRSTCSGVTEMRPS